MAVPWGSDGSLSLALPCRLMAIEPLGTLPVRIRFEQFERASHSRRTSFRKGAPPRTLPSDRLHQEDARPCAFEMVPGAGIEPARLFRVPGF